MAFSLSISLQLPLSVHFLLYRHPQSLLSTSTLHSLNLKVYQEEMKQIGFSSPLYYRLRYRQEHFEHDDDGADDYSFDQAVFLFNNRDYYRCHDFLESLWNNAQEPRRTLIHGVLQCAVGFHHLFNQNHRGAMMELGEGLCKLRKMNFQGGPFHSFEQEISAAVDFIYQTQLELAACSEDLCLTMDGSERSYQLLGSFAAGQHIYNLESESDETYIVFSPQGSEGISNRPRVKIPTLHATEKHLMD